MRGRRGGEEEEWRRRGGEGLKEKGKGKERRRGRLQAGLQHFTELYLGHVSNRLCVDEYALHRRQLTGVGVNMLFNECGTKANRQIKQVGLGVE